MKTKLLLAGASVLALTWSVSTQAENVGVGVLEPQAVLHVSGDVGNANDVILENLNAYDGVDDTENVLLIDEDDGQRVKTVPLTSLTNSSFSFDGGTNILSITEGGVTRTVDLSDLQDSINDTNTTIVSLDYAADTNILTIVDSDLNQFDVDLTDLEDALTALNLGNSDLVQTPTDTVRTYDISGQTLNFTNGAFIVGDSPRAAGTESHFQSVSVHAGRGYVETPAVYTHIIEALSETGGKSTGIAVGQDGHFNATADQITLFTDGAPRLNVDANGALNFSEYGANNATVSGNATNDKYLTVNSAGDVREVDAPIDTTVSNTGATLDNTTNVLTISDETGDVTVDISSVDTDTFVSFATPLTAPAVDGTTTKIYPYTAADGSSGQLTFDDQNTDQSATLTDNLNGSYTFQQTVIAGQPIAFQPIVIDTIQNTAASLDAQNVLTITDEAGDVTVDLSAVDTDTTDLDWAVSSSASDLSAAIGDSIYTNGNVGINTNVPSYPLVVDTASTQNALVVREAIEGGQTLGRVGVGTDTPGYSLDVSGDIRATGNIYSGDQFLASNFFQTSDRRLKTEIEGFNRGLEILRQMSLVSYRYNGLGLPTNTERLHYGVLAQELQDIDPELVGSFYSPEDNMDYLTVNVQSMTYVLANALQQLDAENARITAVLLDSEARISRLEKRLRLMEARLGVSDQ
ncbi:MAG: tail fiber domain-containing protein [Alphaproteobacteria bacterium]